MRIACRKVLRARNSPALALIGEFIRAAIVRADNRQRAIVSRLREV
jgi:hypothetical protein